MTQVLIVNLLLIVAAVVAAIIAANPNIDLGEKPGGGAGARLRDRVHDRLQRLPPPAPLQAARASSSTRWSAPTSRGRAPTCATPSRRSGPEEVERLHQAFIRMLERLEAERRRASSAALDAQEEERARVARDLHDEVNQSLTGLLLRLEATREKAPPELAAELAEIRALANQAMQELLVARAPAAPDGARRPRAQGGARQPRDASRPPERDRDQLRGRRRPRLGAAGRPDRRLPRRPGGALERRPPLGRRAICTFDSRARTARSS